MEEEGRVEVASRRMRVPPWTQQITLRAVLTSFVLSGFFVMIVCKLTLTSGTIAPLNVAAGFSAYAVINTYTTLLSRNRGHLRFTRQEHMVILTVVAAASGTAFNGGIGAYLLSMSPYIASQVDEGNKPINTKTISLGWMFAFFFAVSFVGLFCIVPMRKVMILKYRLSYPSGTAMATLLNSLHTPQGAKLAKKQVAWLFKSFGGSFLSGFFQWFYTAGDGCGFSNFPIPIYGLQAYSKRFYLQFSPTFVGVGMICPHLTNAYLLLGAIASWGFLWPFIEHQKGIWYSADLPSDSLSGIQGYRLFITIAIMLGDSLYHCTIMPVRFVYYLITQCLQKGLYHCTIKPIRVAYSLITQYLKKKGSSMVDCEDADQNSSEGFDAQRTAYFLKDEIPFWVGIIGYSVFAVISIITASLIFPQLKWYHILIIYLIAPILACCSAYECGLTDWSSAQDYGRITIIIFSSWVGLEHGGIIAGLASCGIMMTIVSKASDLMQDFKTGYLTLTSPMALFLSQVLGTAIGCLVSPLTFWLFHEAYRLGDPQSSYPAPFGEVYRGMALIGTKGFFALPKYCLQLAILFFFIAVCLNIVHDLLEHYETKYRLHKFVPNPMNLAMSFYLGGSIDMCIGNLIMFLWKKMNEHEANELDHALVSGLICGDSLWGVAAAILSLAGVNPPMCMKFLSRSMNKKVDTFLSGGH